MRKPSIYAGLYVKNSYRAKFTPRVGRPHRPRVIAWAGPDAFYNSRRFYEIDGWYKARIQKPELLPKLHVIDPDIYVESFDDKIRRNFQDSKKRQIDIGFKTKQTKVKAVEDKSSLEPLSRKNKLRINLELADFDHILVAEHFNIFQDLFMPGVYFRNTQLLNIIYGADATVDNCRVHLGNIITTSEAIHQPKILIGEVPKQTDSASSFYNTLVMVNLEGNGRVSADKVSIVNGKDQKKVPTDAQKNITEQETIIKSLDHAQMLHWLVANIPNAQVDNAETIVPYLQPIPFYGTGYHRIAFILFRHREKIDLSHLKNDSDSLDSRAFKMNVFYKSLEDQISPSAVRFSLMKWDESCDKALHSQGLKSPRYWYEWNEEIRPEQREFPKKAMPFNQYLDMYRNPASVRKEIRAKRLEMLVKLPRGAKLEPQEYPDLFFDENDRLMPQFMHQKLIRQNMGLGVWALLYEDHQNPAEQHVMEKWVNNPKLPEPIKMYK